MNRLRVLQVLPELNSGGVERGTVDFARYLSDHGHESWVMSAGGRMLEQLLREGSRHVEFPVHRKSLLSFLKIKSLRREIYRINPDIVHVRSRMPAWLVWLALKNDPKRPALISTFHGLYSVSFYSAIMGCGDRVIAISNCVKNYVEKNYPKIDAAKIHVIHRGVDTQQFFPRYQVDDRWRSKFEKEHPNTINKSIILMPGRLSPWKGQRCFIDVMEALLEKRNSVVGLIVGDAANNKTAYVQSLRDEVLTRRLTNHIVFIGHCSEMENLYKMSSVVVNLSQHAEPFGRTVIESLALGIPVVAFDEGGPAESLRDSLPQGLVRPNDVQAVARKICEFIDAPPRFNLSKEFTLDYQAEATLKLYREALDDR